MMAIVMAVLLMTAIQDDVSKWIADLEADDIETRERAEGKLLEAGSPALDALREAVKAARGDAATRLKTLIERISTREKLRSQLIAGQNNGLAFQALIQAAQKGEPAPAELRAVCLSIVRAPGNLTLKQLIANAAIQTRLPELADAAIELIRDPVAWATVNYMVPQLSLQKRCEEIVADMVASDDEPTVRHALAVATQLGLADVAPRARALLRHASKPLRLAAAQALVAFGRADDVTALLGASEAEARRIGLELVQSFSLQVKAEQLVALLADPDPETRARSLDVLWASGRAPEAAVLRGLLADPDPRVRKSAVGCAMYSECAPQALELLKDKSGDVRAAVLDRLASFPADAVVETLKSLAADESTREQGAYAVAVYLRAAPGSVHRVMIELVGRVDAKFMESVRTYSEILKSVQPQPVIPPDWTPSIPQRPQYNFREFPQSAPPRPGQRRMDR